jgi:tRNA pseudouridine38-40 synthase
MKNILLTIEYDGTNFSGWQRQPDQRTVQGELERVLSLLCDQEITISGTSRTDAGVHAYGQRATFKGEFGIPTERIPKAANDLLRGRGHFAIGDIRILAAAEVPEEFHARFDAKGKTYWYNIRNAREPDIMQRNYCYQMDKVLDLTLMRQAASYLVGEHDFKGFMAAGGTVPLSTVRTIYQLEIVEESAIHPSLNWLRLEVTGNGFLYNMVRIITGTLVDVGAGKLEPETVLRVLEARDRSLAGHTAPPQGLYLAEVYFDPEHPELRIQGRADQ